MRPKKIKIGLFTYPVTFTDGWVQNGDGALSGQIRYSKDKRGISIATRSNDEAVTLLHEIMHGMMTDRCLPEPPDVEQFVDSLSKGFLAVLRENKGLADYLVDPYE